MRRAGTGDKMRFTLLDTDGTTVLAPSTAPADPGPDHTCAALDQAFARPGPFYLNVVVDNGVLPAGDFYLRFY